MIRYTDKLQVQREEYIPCLLHLDAKQSQNSKYMNIRSNDEGIESCKNKQTTQSFPGNIM